MLSADISASRHIIKEGEWGISVNLEVFLKSKHHD